MTGPGDTGRGTVGWWGLGHALWGHLLNSWPAASGELLVCVCQCEWVIVLSCIQCCYVFFSLSCDIIFSSLLSLASFPAPATGTYSLSLLQEPFLVMQFLNLYKCQARCHPVTDNCMFLHEIWRCLVLYLLCSWSLIRFSFPPQPTDLFCKHFLSFLRNQCPKGEFNILQFFLVLIMYFI